ncbi:MAG: nitroreductase [Flammeovirgaceae bacterium]|nr:nitroreductase [Flammeovirgaceae bacterium]
MILEKSQLNDLIKNRRSVYPKDYTGEAVSEHIIYQMLENATWAPTHKRTEPWYFIVYSGEGRKKLAALQAELYKRVTVAKGTFEEDRYQGLLSKPLESSHIIVVCMKRDEKKSVPEIEEIGAVYCAVQNMYLTATAYEVGCYLSTGGITFYEEAKEAFGLNPEDRILGFLQVGMPKHREQKSARKPIEEKVKYINT